MRKAFMTLLAGLMLVLASAVFFMVRQETVANILIIPGVLIECYAVLMILRSSKTARKKD